MARRHRWPEVLDTARAGTDQALIDAGLILNGKDSIDQGSGIWRPYALPISNPAQRNPLMIVG